jgi:SprT protein
MKELILNKVEECFQIAEKFYNRTFERPQNIIFKTSGTTGGTSNFRKKELMFQLDFAIHNPEDYIRTTVPHEVAHYVQRAVYGYFRNGKKVMPHGQEWKYVMRYVYNLNPDRCHNYDTSVTRTKKQTTHLYGCGCGKEFNLTTTMHNKILKGSRRICKSCRGTITLKKEGNPIEQKMQQFLLRYT